MKVFNVINAIFSLLLTIIKYGNTEVATSISVRQELETELNLKKVSILLAKLEQVQDLDLPKDDKELLTASLQAKIQALLSPK